MIKVNKGKYRQDFNLYTKAYLHDSYNCDDKCFVPSLDSDQTYKDFSNRKYKSSQIDPNSEFAGWLSILLKEQDNRCCYCMRYLDADISVEHLVPENFTGLNKADEVNYYNSFPEIAKYVSIDGKDFPENDSDIDGLSKFPHLIAHSNLYPTCNVKYGCSCNNKRGNKRIIPIMLDVDGLTIEYNKEGKLILTYPDTVLAENTLNALDINTKTLKEIRHMWYLCAKNKVKLTHSDNLEFPQRHAKLLSILGLSPDEIVPPEYSDFLNESYWNLFVQFDWFYTYFENKISSSRP